MARPPKKGLDYFPLDINLFWNDKIFALTERYGTKGQSVYIALLCEVYRDGYYLEIPAERLAAMIMRSVGRQYFSGSAEVQEMIDYCAVLGLFDRELYGQGVITSVGIQERYVHATVRRKQTHKKYWLLSESESKSDQDCDQKIADVTEEVTSFFSAETPVTVYRNATKKTKENQTKQNERISNQIREDQTEPEPFRQGGSRCAVTEETEPQTGCAADDEMMINTLCDFEAIKKLTAEERSRVTELCYRWGHDRMRKAAAETVRRGGKSLAYAEKVLATITAAPAQRVTGSPWGGDLYAGIYSDDYIAALMDDGA